MAQTNNSRPVAVDALLNTIRRSMFNQGIVGSTMQSYYDRLQTQQLIDVIDEQNTELRNNSQKLDSLNRIATTISANVFAIANLLQKQYNLAVRRRMMQERERFRREALAEEAIFESPRYSATEEDSDSKKSKSKKGFINSKFDLALRLTQLGALISLGFPEAVSGMIQQAEKQIDDFTTSAKNFLSNLIDGYVEEDNSEATLRSEEEEKEEKEDAIEDLETDRLVSEIDAEYEIQDKEIDSTIESGNDLSSDESDTEKINDYEPPKPMENPSVSMRETGMDLPAISETPESYRPSNAPIEPLSIDRSDDFSEKIDSAVYRTTNEAIPLRPVPSVDFENPKIEISNQQSSMQKPEPTIPPTPYRPAESVSPLAQPISKPTITDDNLNPYTSPTPTNISDNLNPPIPNIEPGSYLPNTNMPVNFNPQDAQTPMPTNIGSVIGEITTSNRAMSILPVTSKSNVIINNQSGSQVASAPPGFIVPSPIANRGTLEIGTRFDAGR